MTRFKDNRYTFSGGKSAEDKHLSNEQSEVDNNVIFTIGHSTRPVETFMQLLEVNRVTRIIDIRTIPRSRYNPQYNSDILFDTLAKTGIAYQHLTGLGGLRRTQPDSPNTGWHNASFRGFADYMQTAEFEENLQFLIRLVKKEIIALMCAEALPWRCHRSLIADALVIRGMMVKHILNLTNHLLHVLTPWSQVSGNRIIYPSQDISRE
ncbi:MAG: DUF488 domain-containing protein [Nitrospira sp.]|nr:DUF488 domain-containing protein [Nitrospira sp.]